MDMNAASILRLKTVSIISAGFLGAGLLGGVAFAAAPAATDATGSTVPNNAAALASKDKDHAKLKTVLDALVAKNVITQAQEDAILAALKDEHKDHPKLREFVGDVAKESSAYLGIPADELKKQLMAGKSLGEIANGTAGKSRDGLLNDLDAKAADRIQAAVKAGKLTQAQADALLPKVDEAIVKIVDHKGSPKPTVTGPGTAAGGTLTKPAKPTN
jgi:hypothetical protein